MLADHLTAAYQRIKKTVKLKWWPWNRIRILIPSGPKYDAESVYLICFIKPTSGTANESIYLIKQKPKKMIPNIQN